MDRNSVIFNREPQNVNIPSRTFVFLTNQRKKLHQWVRHFLSGSFFWDPEGRSPHAWLWICNIIFVSVSVLSHPMNCGVPNTLHQVGSSSRSGMGSVLGAWPSHWHKVYKLKVFPQSSSYLIGILYMNTFYIHYIWIHLYTLYVNTLYVNTF